MAHMMGSGLATLIDRRAGFQRFYGEDAALFYDGLDDLAARLEPLLADDDAARDLARRGCETTWRLFDSNRVLAYLLDQLFVDGGARDYEWPSERWGRCAIARRASSVARGFQPAYAVSVTETGWSRRSGEPWSALSGAASLARQATTAGRRGGAARPRRRGRGAAAPWPGRLLRSARFPRATPRPAARSRAAARRLRRRSEPCGS